MVEVVPGGNASSQDPIELAAAKALLAHHALGRMSASATVAEFSEAVRDFLAAARSISRLVEQAADRDSNKERRRAYAVWFGTQVAALVRHPVESAVTESVVADKPPEIYAARLARGSGPPPFDGAHPPVMPKSARPDDFYFERSDKRPAISLCADYLEHLTELLDQSKLALKRLGAP